MEIKLHRLKFEWETFSTIELMKKFWPDLDLFEWVENTNRSERWIIQNARMWDVYDGTRWIGYVAATSHYKGRWVFHFGSIRNIDHKSVIPATWRLFLQEAEKENVKLVAVYIPDDRADIRRLARIFKFRHFFGNLWANPLKHLRLSRSNRPLHQLPQKMTA